MRASVCMCVCVRVRVRARGLRWSRCPAGAPPRMGANSSSHACGVAKVEARGHAPGVGRIVIVTVTPLEVRTPVTAGGEHRRARRCSPSGGGGWKCRQLAPRHVMTPRSRATHSLPPSPPRPWVAVSREAARGGALPADLIPYDVTSGHSRLAFCTNSHSADQAIIRRCAFAPCL